MQAAIHPREAMDLDLVIVGSGPGGAGSSARRAAALSSHHDDEHRTPFRRHPEARHRRSGQPDGHGFARDRLQGRSSDGSRGPVAIIKHPDERMLLTGRSLADAPGAGDLNRHADDIAARPHDEAARAQFARPPSLETTTRYLLAARAAPAEAGAATADYLRLFALVPFGWV